MSSHMVELYEDFDDFNGIIIDDCEEEFYEAEFYITYDEEMEQFEDETYNEIFEDDEENDK